jgi:hypothetical protein
MPTRKTGITSKVFRFERAEITPSTEWDFRRVFEFRVEVSASSAVGSGGMSRKESGRDVRGSGMTASNTKHRITDPIARPHGIQGEISVVTDAMKDATSSAM